MGRSGTTLLGRVLAAHPHVGFLNEPKAMWHVIRDDEDVIGSDPKLPGRLYLDRADAGDAVARRAHSLYAWYLTASRSRRLVDKYPELIFRHEFVRAIFPDARFLIAIREPFAALESVARWSVSHERDGVDWWGLDDLKWRILWSEGVAGRPANSDLAELGLSAEEDGRVRAAVEWLVTAREAIELMDRDPAASPSSTSAWPGNRAPRQEGFFGRVDLPPSPRTEAYAAAVVEPSRPVDRREAGGAAGQLVFDARTDVGAGDPGLDRQVTRALGGPHGPAAALQLRHRFELGAQAAQASREDLLHVGETEPGQLGDLRSRQVAPEPQRDQLAGARERRERATARAGSMPRSGSGTSLPRRSSSVSFERSAAAQSGSPGSG